MDAMLLFALNVLKLTIVAQLLCLKSHPRGEI